MAQGEEIRRFGHGPVAPEWLMHTIEAKFGSFFDIGIEIPWMDSIFNNLKLCESQGL
jgi:hypothetical protein